MITVHNAKFPRTERNNPLDFVVSREHHLWQRALGYGASILFAASVTYPLNASSLEDLQYEIAGLSIDARSPLLPSTQ